jgi:DNA-binding NarL/FixJ family response regulator
MTVRVLLAESDVEDVLFLRDVLEEMESSEFWSGWLHLDIFDAPDWANARDILAREPIDVILLDLNLAKSNNAAATGAGGAECFRQAQAATPHVPVVLLVDESGVDLAGRLIREGAQDFLVKKHIDCEPLAHALRNAIGRHQLLAAARAAAMTDQLTGLLNRAAFEMFAGRDTRLAEFTGRRMAVVVARPTAGDGDDLALVEAADQLRGLAGPTDLVARIGEYHFGIAMFETDTESLEQACARYQNSFGTRSLRTALATFNPYQPATLDVLLERAESDLAASAVAARAS